MAKVLQYIFYLKNTWGVCYDFFNKNKTLTYFKCFFMRKKHFNFFDQIILLTLRAWIFLKQRPVKLNFKFTSSALFCGSVQACQLFSHFASVLQTSLPGSWEDQLEIIRIPKTIVLTAVCRKGWFVKVISPKGIITLLLCLPGLECLPLRRNLEASILRRLAISETILIF